MDKAPSNKAVIGRYILPKLIFNKLKKQKKGKEGEIHITDAIQSLILENNKFYVFHVFARKCYNNFMAIVNFHTIFIVM